MGPSYRDVAQKYKGQPNASAVLAKRVREGSKGVWGPVPMPPNAGPKDAEITAMVAYVLAP